MTERAHLATRAGDGTRPQDAGHESLDWAIPTAAIIGGWTGHALAGLARHWAGPRPGDRAPPGERRQRGRRPAARGPLLNASGPRLRGQPAGGAADGLPSRAASGGGDCRPAGRAPAPGPSWTKIGPPKPASFSVSGTLREVGHRAGGPEGGRGDDHQLGPRQGDVRATGGQGADHRRAVHRLPDGRAAGLDRQGRGDANQQAEWDRFSVAIAAHEAGHVATDKTVLRERPREDQGPDPGRWRHDLEEP